MVTYDQHHHHYHYYHMLGEQNQKQNPSTEVDLLLLTEEFSTRHKAVQIKTSASQRPERLHKCMNQARNETEMGRGW